jgi:AhpD family alkylhydroperoxidase
MSEATYPEELRTLMKQMEALKEANGPAMGGFHELHQAGMADGALSTKTKELIALAIAVTIRCEGCIVFHMEAALRAGATHQEISDAVGVSLVMGGGPSMVYGAKAIQAMHQFEEQ